MILLLAVAGAVASVPLLGGRLGRLHRLHFRWPLAIAVALALQVLVMSVLPRTIPTGLSGLMHVASYLMAVAFLWANRKVPWLWLLGVGGISNLVAIGANDGVMPASKSALEAAGMYRGIRIGATPGFSNSAYRAGQHLRLLGDVFAIPRGWPLANVFSIGDILIVVGTTLLLHAVCGSRPARAGSTLAIRWRPTRSGVPAGPSVGPAVEATPTA